MYTKGVSHFGLAIYMKKGGFLKANKRRNYGNSKTYFTMQTYNLPKKNPLKETKIP
jgi:hypothetical protein